MFNFFKKTDKQIQQDVVTELTWDPSVSPARIKVTSEQGIVTLRGSVPHYFEKSTAREAAQRVGGVRAVSDEIEVRLHDLSERSDEDIARAVLSFFEWNYQMFNDLKVTVDSGWVTLSGKVDWEYKRKAAAKAISQFMGVRGLNNEITINDKVQPSDLKFRIQDALKRSAESRQSRIRVAVDRGQVTISGNVRSFSESEEARLVAWNGPGVMGVKNDLKFPASIL